MVHFLAPSMTYGARTAQFEKISSALATQSDQQLTWLVDQAEQLACGIGGATVALEIDGVKVFAKRLRLTELERRPENLLSTENIFALPTFCQRNVGSVGFGAWRELAANVMTTGWVLSQQLENFPLMYHWRMLEGAVTARAAHLPKDLVDIEGMVRYWEGSDAMGARLKALADATASVVIFLEYVPWNLSAWLAQQLAAGPDKIESACVMVERGLTVDVASMNSLGLLHGDAHFENILTDGQKLYFADLGLALSERFTLSADELSYLHHNASLDRGYVLAKWVNWLVKTWAPAVVDHQERMELIRAAARGRAWSQFFTDLPSSVAAIIRRHAAIAALVNDFYVRLHSERRNVPYPRDGIESLLQSAAR